MKTLMLILITLPFIAAARKPAAVTELRTRSIHGDRDVRFLFKNEDGKITVQRLIDGKDLISRSLKQKEWDFLIGEFQKLPQAPKIPPECARARMDIVYMENGKPTVRNSCFGIKTITSDAYAKFAQILSLAF